MWLLLLGLLAAPVPALAAEFVIHVSVDGLSATLLETLVANDTQDDYANFERFVAEGATTWNARTDYTHTLTLPNHTSMLTGRPVARPAGQPNTVHHGYTANGDPPPGTTLHDDGNPNLSYVASVFDVIHDHGLSTALFASKGKFVLFEWSYDADSGAPDSVGPDDGRDKIDSYANASASSMHAQLLTAMAQGHFRYVFVHYSTVDDAGHASGWGSAAWNSAVRTVDGYLGDIFALVEGDPILRGRTWIIVSADHGGSGTGHSDPADPANYVIPFFVWGAGVAPGADLYALNAAVRADPGGGRPDYNAVPQPIRNGDGANLALSALGLPAIPGSSIDAGQELVVGTLSPIPLLSPLGQVVLALLLAGSVALRGPGRARERQPLGFRFLSR